MIRFDNITIDRRSRTITHVGQRLRLPQVLFRLASALLLAGPRTTPELFDIVYRDDPDGGPLTANNICSVMLVRLEPRLAAIGLDVHREGTPRRYWAAPSKQEIRRAA